MSHIRSSQSETQVAIPAAGETFVGDDGVVSVVLDDKMDENYEPTEEEIEEFATWMGMQLPEDKEFLYIAREGLKAPLPKDWKPCRTNEDEIYYFNFRTGESTWNHPMDEFFREKFLKEKEGKKETDATRHELKTSSLAVTASAAAAAAAAAATSSNSNSNAGPIPIMQNPSSSGIGAISGNARGTVYSSNSNTTTTTTTNSMITSSLNTTKGSIGAYPFVLKTSSLGVPSIVENPTTIITATPLSSPRGVIGNDGSKQITLLCSGERRIISEAEKNLEEKIRQEREMEFKVETEKADALQQERLENVRQTRATDLNNLQEEYEKKLKDMRDKITANKETSLDKKRQELEEKWAPILGRARQEEKDLQEELVKLEEDYKGCIASEVTKAESAEKERFERLQKEIELETKGSIEKMRREAHAEYVAKKNEVQKRIEREIQQLKEAAEKQHKKEIEALEKKHKEEIQQTSESLVEVEKSTKEVTEEALIVANIQEKKKKAVEDIVKKSKEDQAELRTSMEATLRRLRQELCELEGPISISLNPSSNDPSSEDILKEVRDRVQAEEAKRMRALGEDRRKQLAALTRPRVSPTTSTPASPTCPSSTTTTTPTTAVTGTMAGDGKDVDGPPDAELRAANDALLAEKAAALQKLETFLRATLEREFSLGAETPPADRVRAAAAGAVAVFGRATELRQRLAGMRAVDGAEFERRRRSAEERRRRGTAEVEVEVQQYAEERRSVVEAQEKARADAAEAQMRREAEERAYTAAQERVAAAEAEAAIQLEQEEEAQRKAQEIPGVPLEVLQSRLGSITKTYAEQEQKLQEKLDSIRMETRKIGEIPVTLEPVPIYHYQQQKQEHEQQQKQQEPPPPQEQQQQQQQQGQEQYYQLGGVLFPETSNTTTLPLSNINNIHSSPFSSEALRFLNEQQRELSARRGALRAAREEWQNDVRNASRVPSPVNNGDQVRETVEGGTINAQLLTLVEVLGNRLEHLTRRIAKGEMTTDNLSPRHQHSYLHRDNYRHSPLIQKHQNSHRQSRLNRHEQYEEEEVERKKSRIKDSPRKRHLNESPEKKHLSGNIMQKWSQILLDLAAPPPNHSELSASIQRYVSDR
ncbi:WW domain [Trypanosoma melophagium]|uniref:WW domain n=1 Tax=Trypanosoma melophagium TaxID=715481 RepID=UPI003519FFC5|nr:WW domain [Trypanosoma melophagium]